MEGHPTITSPGPLNTVKFIKNKGHVKKCHNQEESKETWWVSVIWDPGTEKDIR